MKKTRRDYIVFWKSDNNFNFFLSFQLDFFVNVSLNSMPFFITEKQMFIIFNNFYQLPKNLNSIKLTNSNNLKIYYFFFILFFFNKKYKFIFNRSFFYFFIFNNTFFLKKKYFYINHRFFVAKFFFNFFINFNLFFNKLFFEVNFYKFKRSDNLKKNIFFLNNLFLGNTQNFYKVLDYSKAFAGSFLPDFTEHIIDPNIDKITISLFTNIFQNKKTYMSFFNDDISDEEVDIFKISNQRIFNVPQPVPTIEPPVEYVYPKNCDFVSFFYLFTNLLKLLVLNNIDEFLKKKIEFFSYVSFFDTSIFENINIFLYYQLNETYILNDITKIECRDSSENSNYFSKLVNNYKYYNNFFLQTYNISTYWDNSFFGVSNYSSFNYLFILNNFFFKKIMYNLYFLRKKKKIISNNTFKYLNFSVLRKKPKSIILYYNSLFFINFNFIVLKPQFFFNYIDWSWYSPNFFYHKHDFEPLNAPAKLTKLRKMRIFKRKYSKPRFLNYSTNDITISRRQELLRRNYNFTSDEHSVNFFKKNKFFVDVSKFMYYDNLNFSFYFLNFFKQFKYNIVYLLISKRCSHKTALNFFKLSTSFNFFYFINLAPSIIATSLGKSLNPTNNFFLTSHKCTNHTPIFFFSDFIKTKLLSFFKSSQISQFTFFYQYFLIQTLEFILNCKIYIKVFSLLKLVIFLKKNQFIKFIKSKYRYFNSKIGKGFFLVEVIEVFWITFLFKDTEFFMFWFTKTMGRLYYRKQKVFIYFLKIILMRHFCNIFSKLLNFKGFLFDIRGKVGVSGNSKKRHMQFNWGVTSFTKKSLKLRYSHGLVFTYTGVMGVTFIITY